MNCKQCNHYSQELTHDLCRPHALCAVDGRYDRTFCVTCIDLWNRVRSNDPDDAIIAMDLLADWIHGFCRNSRQSEYFSFVNFTTILLGNVWGCWGICSGEALMGFFTIFQGQQEFLTGSIPHRKRNLRILKSL